MQWTESTRTGTFRYLAQNDTWIWSPEVYEIFGFSADTRLTTELIAEHINEADRWAFRGTIEDCRESGGIFSEHFRSTDSQNGNREITMAGEGFHNNAGTFDISGFMIDVTAPFVNAVTTGANEQISRALESRGMIDQAKGALMFIYGMDEQAAFATLRWCSQRSNVKLTAVAERIITALSTEFPVDTDIRTEIDETLYLLTKNTDPAILPDIERSSITTSLDRDKFPGEAIVLTVNGDIDLGTVATFSMAVNQLIGAYTDPAQVAILDLSGVDHFGSAGAPVIITAQRKCNEMGGTLRVVRPKFASSNLLPALSGIELFDDAHRAASS